jgi:RHS repeat-associated protein
MSFRSHLVTKGLHVFVVVSIVLASVPLTSEITAQAAPSITADVTEEVAVQHQPAPTPGPALEAEDWNLRVDEPISETVYLPLVMHNCIPGPQATASVDVRVEPWMALPGDWVTGTLVVSSTGELPMRDGVLIARLPVVLGSPSVPGATYAALENELRWDVGALAPGQSATVTFGARVAAGPKVQVAEVEATFVAQAVAEQARPPVTADMTTTILIGESVTATIDPEGGSATTPDENVHFVAPPGAVTQPVTVRVANFPLPEWDVLQPRWLALFDLRAEDAAAQALMGADGHLRFLQPLTVTVDLNDTADWMDAYLLHCQDTVCEELLPMDSDYDPETDILTAAMDTFSPAGAAGDNPFPTDGSHYLFENWPAADLYSGGLSYGISIPAPAGVGGMEPGLSLGYGSRSLDGMQGIVQSPSAGVGWSMGGVAQITRKIKTHEKQGNPYVETRWEYENDFTLMINGTSYKLTWGSETGVGCRYYTAERSGLRVMRYNGLCGYESGRPPNEGGEYWVVTAPDGTRYRFGYRADAEQVVPMNKYTPQDCTIHSCPSGYWHKFDGYAGDSTRWVIPAQWAVDWVKDTHGNAMRYTYLEEERDYRGGTYDRSSYLRRIEYGGNYDENDSQRSPMRYRVDVVLESRNGHDDGPEKLQSYTQWESQRVHSIRVCVGSCVGNNVLREVVLAYDEVRMKHPGVEWGEIERPEVTVLREVQQYGRGGEAGGAPLPPIRLGYDAFEQVDDKYDKVDGGLHGDKLRYHRLVRVENGCGGWITFEYERLEHNHVYSYRVKKQRQGDGMGHVAWTRYTYNGACFADKKDVSRCRRDQPKNQALLGHTWTEELAYDYGGAPLVRVRHDFHRDRDKALGREYRTVIGVPGGATMQTTSNTWHFEKGHGGIQKRYLIELAATQSCQGSACSRTEYDYDQYGNLAAEYALGDLARTGDERTTRKQYVYDEGRWIVSLPVTEMLYWGVVAEDAPSQAKARGYFYYDGQAHGAPPQTGDVTRTDVWQLGGPYTTRVTYDLYGNALSQTNALGQVATTTYDGVYHQFPVQTCAAAGTEVEQCTTIEYYGVNGPSLNAVGASFGATYRTWGPNGEDTATRTWYDEFGRPWKVARPGDTQTLPTQELWYDESTSPDRPVHEYYSDKRRDTLYQSLGSQSLDSTYVYEATPFRVWATQQPGTVPLYRLFHDGGSHRWQETTLYTTSEGEKEGLEASRDWHYEGILGYVWTSPGPGREPLYRCRCRSYRTLDYRLVVGQPCPEHYYLSPSSPIGYVASADGAPVRLVVRQRQVGGEEEMLDHYAYYDDLGRTLQTRVEMEGGWSVASQTYDGLGRVERSYLPRLEATAGYAAPAGHFGTATYDALGRAVRVDNADGTHVETTYDGWTTTSIDANGHQRVHVSDAFGQLVRVEEYTGMAGAAGFSFLALYATTRYGYDALGHLTTVTDTNGVATEMVYDDLGRKIAMHDPDMGDWTYGYDLLGNLEWQRGAKGQTVTFDYDDLNRLTGKRADGQVIAEYEYDCGSGPCPAGNYGVGQRTSMAYPGGRVTYRYDARGRVTREVRSFDGFGDYATTFAYDAQDRVVSTTYPDDEVVTQTYDGGSPDTLASSLGETFVEDTAYNAAGQITTLELGNGLQTIYDYDARNLRLLGTQTEGPAGALQDLAYTYDPVGNVLTVTDGANDGQVQQFRYDSLDRLTHAWTTGGGYGAYDRRYAYDATGNITHKDGLGDYGYGQPAGIAPGAKPHAVTHIDGEQRYWYDANGNQIRRVVISGTQTLTYTQVFDVESRLVAVTRTNGITEAMTRFGYDGDGVRAWRATKEGTTVYVGGYYEEFAPGVSGASVAGDGPVGASPVPDDSGAEADVAAEVEPAQPAPDDRVILSPTGAYGYTDEFNTLNTNYWDSWTHAGINLFTSGGALRAQRGSTHSDSWEDAAGVRLKQQVDFNGNGATLEWRETMHSAASWNLVYAGVWDTDAGRFLYFDCYTLDKSDSHWTNHFECDISLRRMSDGAWLYKNKGFIRVSKNNLTTLRMVNSGPQQVEFYANGALVESRAFTPEQWNGMDWVEARWYAIGWEANASPNTGNPNVIDGSLDRFSHSGSVDNIAPSITLGGPLPGVWYKGNPAITYSGSDGQSGFKCIRAQWDNWPPNDGNCFATSCTTYHPGEGSRTLYVRAWDWAGNQTTSQLVYYRDLTPPAGSITIDGGAPYTNNPSVTLSLFASDPASGVSQMHVWNDGQSEPTAWESYATSKSWTLRDLDGVRTVYVRFRDAVGNESPVYQDTIGLDRTSPADGSVTIDGGAEWTTDSDVTLSIAAADPAPGSGVADMRVWNEGEGEPTDWEPYTSTKSWTLLPGNGVRRVYVRFRDGARNVSALYSDAINVDGVPPTGSILINLGAGYTNARDVALNLSALDIGGSDVSEMHFQNDGGTWSTWEPYADSRSWTLRDLDGVRTVRVEYRDGAGNVSQAYSDAIELDRQPPPLAVSEPEEGSELPQNQLWVIATTEPNLGMEVEVVPSGEYLGHHANSEGGFSRMMGGVLRPGANTVTITASDRAGNATTVVRHVTLDAEGPGVTDLTSQGLIADARPVISGSFTEPVDPARVAIWLDGQDVTAAAVVLASGFSYRPSAGLPTGAHRVQVMAHDAAGNSGRALWTFTVDLDTWGEILVAPQVNVSVVDARVAGEAGAVTALAVNGASQGERTLSAGGEATFTDVALQAGGNGLTAVITDALGHVAQDTALVTFDPAYPWPEVSAYPETFAPGGYVDTTQFALDARPPDGEAIAAWRLDVVSSAGVPVKVVGGELLPETVVWDGREAGDQVVAGGPYTYTLVVTATNGLAAATEPQVIRVVDGAPPAPTITSPADGLTTQMGFIWVAGSAEPGSVVRLLDTNGYVTDTVQVDASGQWGAERGLFGGTNELYAVAENAFGSSPPSNHVTVSLVPTPPLYPPVIVLPPTARDGQVVTLSADARDDKPTEGQPTVAVTATVGTTDVPLAKVSGGVTGTWQASWTVAGMGSGDYQVRFVGVDADGYAGDGETLLRIQTPPAAPQFTYPVEPVVQASAMLYTSGWADPFATLHVYDNGSLAATTTVDAHGAWAVELALGEGAHTLTATATDDLGQVSPAATAGEVTIDTRAPVVDVSPLAAYRDQGPIHLTWAGSDPAPGTGVAGYDVQHRLGAGAWQTILGDTMATVHTYTAVEEGRHAFRVRARDAVGNVGAYSDLVWTVVDVTEPTVGLTLSEDGAYAHTSGATVYYGAGSGSFSVRAALADPAPALGEAVGLDQVVFPNATGVGAAYPLAGVTETLRAHTYTFTVGSRFEGSGVVTVTDQAGNESAGTFAVVRDATPPEVTLSAPRRVYTTTFSISWSAVDTQAGVAGYDLEVKVDDDPWQQVLAGTQSTSYQFTNPTGSHFAFRVTATDRVGNAGSVEAASRLVEVTKYYYQGGRRVAMRRSPAGSGDGVLIYLHGDHLGSTSLTTNETGGIVARVLYYPYGETRYEAGPGGTGGTLPTDYQYTGQKREQGIGLYDYNARFYDPYLNRFISADTIVPEPGNPQSFNRYSCVYNNPLKYTDPTGHNCFQIVTGHDEDGNPIVEQHCSEGEGEDWLNYYLGLYYEANPIEPGTHLSWMDVAMHIIWASEMAYEDGVISEDDYWGIVAEAKGLPFQHDPALAFASASYLQVQSQWMYLSSMALPSLFNRSTGYYNFYTFEGETYPAFDFPEGDGHHTYPKALGGHPDQRLAYIPPDQHTGKGGIHSDLASFEGGWLRPKRGMTGAMIVDQHGQQAVENGLVRFYSQPKWNHLLLIFEAAIEYTHSH